MLYKVRIYGLNKDWDEVHASSRKAALSRVISRYIPGHYQDRYFTSIGLVIYKVIEDENYRIVEVKESKPKKEQQLKLF